MKTQFLGRLRSSIKAVNQNSGGRLVGHKLCLAAQAVHLFLTAPMGGTKKKIQRSFHCKKAVNGYGYGKYKNTI